MGLALVARGRDQDAETGGVVAVYLDPQVWSRGLGMTSATLWVLTTNQRARASDEQHGWVRDGFDKEAGKDGAPAHHPVPAQAQGRMTSLPRVCPVSPSR